MVIPSRISLALVWVTLALVLGGLLGISRAARPGLDDPDPARQRPGLLDAGALPAPSPAAGLPAAAGRRVVFFVRSGQTGPLCRALESGGLGEAADLVVVTPAPEACPPAATVADPGGRLARAFGMPTPRAGGPPVGYVIIDRNGAVRYRTLDPGVAERLGEVATLLRATP